MPRPTTHCLSLLQFFGLAFVTTMLAACNPTDDGVQIHTTTAHVTRALDGICVREPDAVVSFTGDVNATDMATLVPALLSDTVSMGSAFVDDGFIFSGAGGDALKTVPLENFTTTDFTAEMWVQASSTNGNNATLMYYGTESGEALRIYNPGSLRVAVGGSSWQSGTLALDDDDWHHLAVTWQSSDGDLRVFLDGLQTHNDILNPGFVLPSEGILRLGQRLNASALGAFTGILQEVTIYDRVLGAAEITSIFAAGHDGKCRPDVDADGTPNDRDECSGSSAAFRIR